jgi:hypothetical protein
MERRKLERKKGIIEEKRIRMRYEGEERRKKKKKLKKRKFKN